MEVQINKYDVIKTGIYNNKHQAVIGYYPKGTTEFKPKTSKVTKEDGSVVYPPISVTGEDEKLVKFLCDWLKEITGEDYAPIKF